VSISRVSKGPEWGGPIVISMALKGPEGVALCWGRWYWVGPSGGPRGYLRGLKRARWEGPMVISMASKGPEGVALCWGR
jgi:hypothetical protein